MATSDGPADLARGFAAIARSLLAAGTVEATLNRIAEMATATVDGCDYAGISLVDPARVSAPIASDQAAEALDARQREVDEGPCLTAMREHQIVEVDDVASETRWPGFIPHALEAGIASILAFWLSVDDETLGALNLYSTGAQAFTSESREIGLIFASHAAMALASARTHASDQAQAAGLRQALVSRDVIGQAKGILMSRDLLTADQAFDVLRRASQRLNEKLRDVAQQVVDTGEAPPAPPPELPPT